MFNDFMGVFGCLLFLALCFGTGSILGKRTKLHLSFSGTTTLGAGIYICGALSFCALHIPLIYWILTWAVSVLLIFILLGQNPFPVICIKFNSFFKSSTLSLVFLIALYNRLNLVLTGNLNIVDDDLAYIPLVQTALFRGGLFDPFCFRSSGSYGGQLVLQAFPSLFAVIEGYQALEILAFYGVALLAVVEVLLSPLINSRYVIIGYATTLILFCSQGPSVNCASLYTAIAFFVLIIEILQQRYGDLNITRKFPIELIIALASFASLRNIYFFWSIAFIITISLLLITRTALPHILRLNSLFIAILSPAICSFYSVFGALFVVAPPSAHLSNNINFYPIRTTSIDYFITTLLETNLLPLIISVLFINRSRSPLLALLTIPSAAIWIAIGLSQNQMSTADIFRYNYPLSFTLTILSFRELIVQQFLSTSNYSLVKIGNLLTIKPLKVILVLFLLFIPILNSISWPGILANFKSNHSLLAGVTTNKDDRESRRVSYELALRQIPQGSSILCATAFPDLLNFRDFQIQLVDIPGAISPTAETRDLSKPLKYISALKLEGIDFIIADSFDSRYGVGIYSKRYWDTVIKLNWHKELLFMPSWLEQVKMFYSVLSHIPQSKRILNFNDSIILYDLRDLS